MALEHGRSAAARRAVLLGMLGASSARAQWIRELPLLPGATSSAPVAVSGDGRVVVGQAGAPGGSRAFRWTGGEGIVDLGTAVPLGWNYSASAASADGSVIVGWGIGPDFHGFRWTTATGMVSLAVFPGRHGTIASGVSADGSVIVGWGDVASGWDQACRWIGPAGPVSLGLLPGGVSSYAYAVSRDGSVVVGSASTAGPSGKRAFRWTGAAGMQNLGVLPGADVSEAQVVSGDGAVVAGYSQGSSVRAFRWTAAAGMVDLGALPGSDSSMVSAVNMDGSVIVGWSSGASGSRAVIWRAGQPIQDLNLYMAASGVNLDGWTLTSAHAVGDDGLTLAGHGEHAGVGRDWVASLACYANCDASTTSPVLNVQDFACFLNKYAAGDTYANCDASTTSPVLNVQDFACFLNKYAAWYS